jgi:nucleoid DNA-binding protein
MNRSRFTKLDTARLVSLRIKDREIHVTMPQLITIISATLDEITEALRLGRTVDFRGFGIFEPVMRKPKIGRNLGHPGRATMTIPGHRAVRFRMSPEMKYMMEHSTAPVKVAKPVLTAEPI